MPVPLCSKSSMLSDLGPPILAVFSAAGMAIFLIFFFMSLDGGRVHEYSCPLSAAWAGLATLWHSFLYLIWWIYSRKSARDVNAKRGMTALKAWCVISCIVAVEGFVSVIGWAVAENEETASGFSALLCFSGTIGALLSLELIGLRNTHTDGKQPDYHKGREEWHSNDANQGDGLIHGFDAENASNPPAQRSDCCNNSQGCTRCACCRCCTCCCTGRFWFDFFVLFLASLLLVFTTGFMVQSTMTASDNSSLYPPGTIYTIESNGVELQMHLYCFGGDGSTNATTVVFEHGGGANSLTLLALAREVSSIYSNRVCIYDRLGYGFTPSLYTSSGGERSPTRLPNSGVLLSRLLSKAGELGPYVCAGHSAGAEACLWLAYEHSEVTGVVMMDGYPDLIRAGSFRPAQTPSTSILGLLRAFAVLAGATGLTRGAVGDPGSNFVPESARGSTTALYGQARFWLSQYWDVSADFGLEEEARLYQKLGGTIDENGLVHYGGTLSGVKVLVLPAAATLEVLDCTKTENQNEYCCGHAMGSTFCQNERMDRELYRNQTWLYASTLSSDTPALVVSAPAGAEHTFVYHRDYYQWIATQIGQQML